MTHAQQVKSENARLLRKGQVAREIKALEAGYLAMKEREEAEEAYVLQAVVPRYSVSSVPVSLSEARVNQCYCAPGSVRVCRLEPVEVRS